jgi:hypothetical protein
MDRKNAVLVVLAGLVLAACATAAMAGERVTREVYWTTKSCGCVVHVRHVRYVRHVTQRIVRVPVRYYVPLPPPPPVEQPVEVVDNRVGLPEGFFADSGGVGPAFIDTGGGGGGGFIEQGGASASASARASVSIAVSFMNRNHMNQMHMMHHGYGGGGGCGCSGGGGGMSHKW